MIRVICVVIGYAFGLFQTAYIIGRLNGIDIRDYGSGNAGTTNVVRTLGTKAGILTFVGDVLKCILAVALVRLLFGKKYADIMPLLVFYTSAGVILGHNFPFYLGFKGGKGIAATAGMVLCLNPIMTVLGLITFVVTFLLTHYVSLGSLLIYVGILIELPILSAMGVFKMTTPRLVEMFFVALFLACLAFYMHRDNIKRLLNGTERKTYLNRPNMRETSSAGSTAF